jgi:L-seryl-tRNA(Ser) seleniumtransferase
MSASEITRRDLLKRSGLLAVPALVGAEAAEAAAKAAAPVPAPNPGAAVYTSIGVRPLINARGTYTIISGSRMLPEVRAAMDAAARHYVHLDELADAIGARLAELTKAEWGLVTSGCAAALTHATAACVAGGNPDLHVRIPDLRGFARDEAIIPRHSRNVYDAAVRAVGVRVVEVETVAELEAAFGPRTALVYILAGPQAEAGPLTTRVLCDAARAKGVPVLVDAAAEVLNVPNVHLEAGATLVAYSGGKCLRGPQTGGMLLGRKDLVRAAWVHSAPHHGYARALKVGKEEAIGMLTAVEMWMKRDHAAEWAQWMSWLDAVAKRVSILEGVRTVVVQPEGLSNKTPSLQVLWDPKRFGITGPRAARHLFDTDPRVAVFPARVKGEGETGLSVTPYMLAAGEEKIVADRIHALLKDPPRATEPLPAPPAADLTGQWDVRIEYAAGTSSHSLHLMQKESRLSGSHQGDFVSRDLSGTIEGDAVRIASDYAESHGDALSYTFSGKVTGDEISGTLEMGEYRGARFSAKRRVRGQA